MKRGKQHNLKQPPSPSSQESRRHHQVTQRLIDPMKAPGALYLYTSDYHTYHIARVQPDGPMYTLCGAPSHPKAAGRTANLNSGRGLQLCEMCWSHLTANRPLSKSTLTQS